MVRPIWHTGLTPVRLVWQTGLTPVRYVLAACLVIAYASPAHAQDTPEGLAKPIVTWLSTAFEKAAPRQGVYPVIGSIPGGAGLSGGAGFQHPLFGTRLRLDAAGAASMRGYTLARAGLETASLASGHIHIGADATRADLTRLNDFGIGPAASSSSRTAYHLTVADYDVFAELKPTAWLTLGSRIGETTPGPTNGPSFVYTDAYAGVDTRDHFDRPTRGGFYRVELSNVNSRGVAAYALRQVDAETAQFVPVLHDSWVLALRTRIVASDTDAGEILPFYILPALGGQLLRGYAIDRFRDRDLFVVNAEYRWYVFGALDAALFYDAGTIAPQFSELAHADLKTSYGIGFRFHTDDRAFLRLDVAHGEEGSRLVFSMHEALRPSHRLSAMRTSDEGM
jgi:hypothetical protein